MMLWFTFAALLLITLGGMLYPLLRNRRAATARIDYDLAVYRSQLNEIEKDPRARRTR